MTTPQEYRAKAEAVLVELAEAKSESERTRLKRAHGVYLRLSTHQAEAAERAVMAPPPRIIPEMKGASVANQVRGWSIK
jgi:hypothetical protein